MTVLTRDPSGGHAPGHRDPGPGDRLGPSHRAGAAEALSGATPSSTSPARTPSAGPPAREGGDPWSRVQGTRNLVAGLKAAEPARRAAQRLGDRLLRTARSRTARRGPPAGRDFLAEVCAAWEAEAAHAAELGMRSSQPDRRRARPERRRALEDAAPVQARRRRPRRRRRPVPLLDPRRGSRRDDRHCALR